MPDSSIVRRSDLLGQSKLARSAVDEGTDSTPRVRASVGVEFYPEFCWGVLSVAGITG
jgi:hypothetical protein